MGPFIFTIVSVKNGEENEENGDDALNDSQKSKEDWKLQKRGGKINWVEFYDITLVL